MYLFKEFTKLYLAMNILLSIIFYLLLSLVNFSFDWPAEFFSGLTTGQTGLFITIGLFIEAWIVYLTVDFLNRKK